MRNARNSMLQSERAHGGGWWLPRGTARSDIEEDAATTMQDGKLSDGRRMLAGFSAGITEALVVVTPFEVVKIRLQQQRGLTKELLRYKVGLRPALLRDAADTWQHPAALILGCLVRSHLMQLHCQRQGCVYAAKCLPGV